MIDCKESRNLTLEIAGIRLQKIQALLTLQLSCSDPLHALSDSKKYSEITVGNRTQWKPAVFAVKRFAVYMIATEKLTQQNIESTQKTFSALAGMFKSVWIVLARCYLDEKLCTKDGHTLVKEWFPDFHVPKMTYPHRGTSKIVKFVKENNEQILEVTALSN